MNVQPIEAASAARRNRSRVGRIGLSLGPAFIAAVAYIDPGNVATNVLAGARYGYLLLWVVTCSSVLAMLIQYLSAKLGTATGKSLPELCHRFPGPVRIFLWLQAEVVVIMTDLAEFVGGAIALNLLFDLSLLTGGLIMTVAVFAILGARLHGRTAFRGVVITLLALVVGAFVFQAWSVSLHPGSLLGGLVPRVADIDSLILTAGIVGATVMPHVIYLHSGLSRDFRLAWPRATLASLVRWNRRDVLLAMTVAGVANASILLAATVLPAEAGESLDAAYHGFVTVLGPFIALAFPIALLGSSLASSLVGVYSGQMIMQGFLRLQVPLMVRRAASAIPPLLILASGIDTTQALVVSQVALSFGIPFALIPLIIFTRDRRLMGELVNRRITTFAATVTATVIVGLNVVLFGSLLGS